MGATVCTGATWQLALRPPVGNGVHELGACVREQACECVQKLCPAVGQPVHGIRLASDLKPPYTWPRE